MWVNAQCVPTGWKVCLTDTYGYIFINDRYWGIPDMRDYSISGNSTMMGGYQKFGTKSPTIAATFSIDSTNLPPHKHGVGTLRSLANTDTFIQFPLDASYHPSYTSVMVNNGKVVKDSPAFDMSGWGAVGGIKWDLTIDGSTADGGFAKNTITLPLNKSIGMIFIIKYNRDAVPHTEGFVTYESIAKMYNEANGKTFTSNADSEGTVFLPGGAMG